jgi:hypothetical protein
MAEPANPGVNRPIAERQRMVLRGVVARPYVLQVDTSSGWRSEVVQSEPYRIMGL